MPTYAWKAIDVRGARRFGRAAAGNLLDLEQRLARMGLDLVTGRPARERMLWRPRSGVARANLINFCFHLEQLTAAGVPILEGLTDLRESTTSPRLRAVIAGLIEAIEGGSSLSDALAEFPLVFGRVFVSLVRSGEQTGRLPEVLKSLTESLKWEDELAAQTKKLLLYPAFAGVLIALVAAFLLVYLVPQLAQFIRGMGQALPPETRLLIALSEAIVDWGWAILAAPFVLWTALRLALHYSVRAPLLIDRGKLALPLFGPILRKLILARFASSFALMYASGITVLDAVRSAQETAGNRVIENALGAVGRYINEGRSLSAAFQETALFPPLVLRMLRVGEATGALDTALANVSYFYGRTVRESVAQLQALLGPALVVVLGGLLLWVILAVLGPLYDSFSRVRF